MHAIVDLYSHSNYIELYTEMYGKQKDLSVIPTLTEVLSDKKYEKFAAVVKERLKTGNYPGEGEGSHKEMNHDVGAGSNYTNVVPQTRGKKVTYETRAAEAVHITHHHDCSANWMFSEIAIWLFSICKTKHYHHVPGPCICGI